MRPQTLLSAAALLPSFATAAPAVSASASASAEVKAAKPVAFILAGDSTTAAQSLGGGGWGSGFISFLKKPAFGTNLGVNGRTTVDYVTDGIWAQVKKAVQDNKAAYDVYVTIQFGHNDQKPEKNITLDQYQANLGNLAKEIKALGGTPILVTPLTRRGFNSSGLVVDNLANERKRTIAAATETKTTYIDLNLYSRKFVQSIGEDKSHSYNLNPTDNTHLNAEGSVVFGRLVADLVLQKQKALAPSFNANKTLSDEIWKAIETSPI